MMLLGDRPLERQARFEDQAGRHVEALEEMAAENPPNYPAINAHLSEKSNEIWRDYKDDFFFIQHRKCGYCEAKVTGSYGDVEHYRPKKAVWDLKSPGRELDKSNKVRGRTFYKSFGSGYWWLAYDWDNYLFACAICNQRWKSALFPVENLKDREARKGDEEEERPLLLDPFGDRDPADHLAFDELGQIEAYDNSLAGKKTIETCGLDRESLRDAREEKAEKTHDQVKSFAREENPEKKEKILKDIWKAGRIKNAHAGMVRAIFKQDTGVCWDALDACFNEQA